MPSTRFLITVFGGLQVSVMAAEAKQTAGYEGRYVQGFQYYLKHSGEHKAILQHVEKILPDEFKRYCERGWNSCSPFFSGICFI